jgi:phosphatidylinositol alpha-1,6-mannosyltransferase
MTSRAAQTHMSRIVGLFTDLLGTGGVQEAGRLTAAALEEIALQAGWVTDFLGLNDYSGPHAFPADERAISFHGCGHSRTQFALAALGRARGGSRIVLAGHPHLALPAIAMQRISPRLRTIIVSHGMEVWKPLSPLRRSALLRADFVLAPSRDTEQKLAEVQGVRQERIQRLAWPLNPNFLRMGDAPGRLPLPHAFPQGQIILTVGRWAASERYKGVDELIRAVAQLRHSIPRLHLVAVGGGDDLPRLQKLVADLGVLDSVQFLDGLSREEIAACYAKADVFALPSTGEGFGLVFLEAMAFGKPVVAAACGGATDLVENEVNGLLVSPGDSGELTKTLERLLRNPSLREELGRRGAEVVRRNYSFETFRAELGTILERCGLDSKLLQ